MVTRMDFGSWLAYGCQLENIPPERLPVARFVDWLPHAPIEARIEHAQRERELLIASLAAPDNLRRVFPTVDTFYASVPMADTADACETVHQVWELLRGHGGPERHPIAPLVVAALRALPAAARPDRWARGTVPRLTTTNRQGEIPTIELSDDDANATARVGTVNLPSLGPLAIPRATTALLPGFAPVTATDIMPASWHGLIGALAERERDPRVWQRALRLLIEVVSHPNPRDRRGRVEVALPIGGPDGLIRRLWPNDARVREHYAALLRSIELVVTSALPVGRAGAFVPAALAPHQPAPDVTTFEVRYPTGSGGGAAFDRHLFRTYGPNPGLFRAYLATVWAMDAPHLRRGDGDTRRAVLDLDTLVDVATFPDTAGGRLRQKRRERMRARLERLQADGAIDFDHEGRGGGQRFALRRALPEALR